jgi:hypothetical protein
MKYSLSIFESQVAMVPQAAELSWDDLISLFDSFKEGDFDKTKQTHFNGVRFKDGGQRNNEGIESIHILVLDYDDGMSIEEAKKHFSDYQHIGYTSYNHQYDKHGDGQVVDKFRILLPLSEPCPFEDWVEVRNHLSTFAPDVDQASTRPHQPYAVPIKRPNSPGEIWVNEGKTVDWSDWERNEVTKFGDANPSLRSPNKLHLDDIIQTKNGSIRVGDVTETINHVYCPFHDDKSPGAFLTKSDKGNIYLHCRSKCGSIYVEQEVKENAIQQFVKKRAKKKPKQSYKQRMIEQYKKKREHEEQVERGEEEEDPLANCYSLDDFLAFSKEYAPFPFKKREEMLRKQYRSAEDKILLYAAEGFGKSSIATILIKEKERKVLFACKSNVQAEEQANTFKKHGINVQLICARDHWLRTIEKVTVEYYEPSHPWDAERVNEVKTKAAMRKMGMDNEMIEQLWEIYEPPKPDFENYDMVITTQARVMGWGRRQYTHRLMRKPDGKGKIAPTTSIPDDKRIVPEAVTIICDDGQMEDFCMLADFDNKYIKIRKVSNEKMKEIHGGDEFEADPIVDGRVLKRKTIGEFEYFVRPKSFLFGHGLLGNQIIFSTTEHITRELIFRRYGGKKEKRVGDDGKKKTSGRVYEPKLIPEDHMKMDAGKITVFKTKAVQKKRDGILPVIAERVREKWDNDIQYVADGQGCALNHITIKGQNTFSSDDMIVEISYAHMNKVTRLLHELEWDESEEKTSRFLKVMLAVDTVHQAIGRNSGYRYADKPIRERGESVVLIEPQIFEDVLKMMRYKVSRAVDLDHVKTKFKRNKIGECFPTTVGWHITNITQYLKMQGGRTFLGDVKRSLRQVGTNPSHPSVRQQRLLDSLRTLLKEVNEAIEDLLKLDGADQATSLRERVVMLTELINQVEDIDTTPSSIGSPSRHNPETIPPTNEKIEKTA